MICQISLSTFVFSSDNSFLFLPPTHCILSCVHNDDIVQPVLRELVC